MRGFSVVYNNISITGVIFFCRGSTLTYKTELLLARVFLLTKMSQSKQKTMSTKILSHPGHGYQRRVELRATGPSIQLSLDKEKTWLNFSFVEIFLWYRTCSKQLTGSVSDHSLFFSFVQNECQTAALVSVPPERQYHSVQSLTKSQPQAVGPSLIDPLIHSLLTQSWRQWRKVLWLVFVSK